METHERGVVQREKSGRDTQSGEVAHKEVNMAAATHHGKAEDVEVPSRDEKHTEKLSMNSMEAKEFIKAAEAELARLNVPFADREPAVTGTDAEVVVTYPAKRGERSGSFIVRLDRNTKKTIDVKVWR